MICWKILDRNVGFSKSEKKKRKEREEYLAVFENISIPQA
jgi:hypothetical protein